MTSRILKIFQDERSMVDINIKMMGGNETIFLYD
jgi:hypothetical protein